MSNNSIGSKLALGLNHLTKKVAAQPAEAQSAVKNAVKAAKVAGDALVRSTAPADKVGQAVGDVVEAAELRLAKAWNEDKVVFARNLAKLTIEDISNRIA